MNGQHARNIIAFLSFVATALNIALAAYVLYKNPRRRENQLFALIATSVAVWSFGDAMYNISHTVRAWSFWVKFQAPGEILFPVLFLHLALIFPAVFFLLKRSTGGKALLACLYIPAIFILVSFYTTEWVLKFRVVRVNDHLTIKGWLYWAYAFFSYALLFAALALYIFNYYRSKRLREKRIAQIMIAAVAIPLLVNILENAGLYKLSSAPCFFTIAAAIFAYGILKHQMFTQVEQVLKRSIVYFTLTVLITSAYVLTIIISERFISSYFSAKEYLITAAFILALVFVFEPLRGLLMKAVDRVFFRKDYEYGQILASLARSLSELSSVDAISRRVTDTLTADMGITGVALLYEPLGEESWGKQSFSGFVPAYIGGRDMEIRLDNDILHVKRGRDVDAAFKVLQIPLVFEREKIGTLLLGEKLSGYDFSFSDRALLEAMAPQMAVALKNGALYQEILEKQQRVNELMEKVAKAHEEERKRIARELHDGVAQSFLGVVYLSEFALENLERDIAVARNDLTQLTKRAHEGLDELRAVIDDLRPIPLEVLGLKGAAAKLLSDINAEGDLETSLESNMDEGERLPPLLEGNLYRILQECLNNVRKHAKARTATVSMMRDDARLTLMVFDDGVGIPGASGEIGSGLGLLSMRERAEEMGGELLVESEVNNGTRVTVTLTLR